MVCCAGAGVPSPADYPPYENYHNSTLMRRSRGVGTGEAENCVTSKYSIEYCPTNQSLYKDIGVLLKPMLAVPKRLGLDVSDTDY